MLNLFNDLPANFNEEQFDDLLVHKNLRIERIVSHGQSSPDGFWYDQQEHEWVTVLKGFAQIEFDDGKIVDLNVGDHLNIAAHQKHRVRSTQAETETIWLAVFYQ
ncbi:cupin domain-containing protein [Vibrio sinensis]|uniref:Cupin domain-containing protein n=1 Tax=Vibrio sinensis TaxID=2302434 RepID=A0A3A6QSB6_9VIBR|nr:cupin domain-containing protein [Vibrio sinensis]